MKLQLGMIILFAKDIDKLKRFYIEDFELAMTEEIPGQWIVLQAGSCQIGLHQIPAAYLETGNSGSNCESNTKMLFDADEDITTLRDRLLNKKLLVKEIQSFDNYPFLICDGEDPEGNIFQLRQKKE